MHTNSKTNGVYMFTVGIEAVVDVLVIDGQVKCVVHTHRDAWEASEYEGLTPDSIIYLSEADRARIRTQLKRAVSAAWTDLLRDVKRDEQLNDMLRDVGLG